MRLALLLLTCLTVFALIVGYLALMDFFDPVGTRVISGANMGLLFLCTGLMWVFFVDLNQTRKKLDKCNRFHSVSGLMNRIATLSAFRTQMKACRRHRFPVSVLLIGMDNFGEVNNRMGHRGGDIILKQVAERIDSVTRDEDITGHYEGDVFFIAACHSDGEGAEKLASRLLEKIMTEPYKTRGVNARVSASIAVATVPPQDYDPEQILYKAEERLKIAKSLGGGKVQLSE